MMNPQTRTQIGAVEETIPAAMTPLDCGPAPAFGRVFTPGILVAEWREETGWAGARLVAQGALPIHPAAVAFHYGQAIFEGMKAHRQPDGRLGIFRLRDHAARFARSAARMAMAPVPEDLFAAYLTRFVQHQGAALPNHPGMTLYLRPLMIGTEAALGIRASNEYRLVILGSPVAPYFHGSANKGLRVQVCEEFVRAAPGETGAVKVAGNYGRGLLALRKAREIGCDQVIWLDARERRTIEEMEGMNFFCVRDGVLVTPPVSETILAGFTRDSLLAIARDSGIAVREEPIPLAEFFEDVLTGRVTEAFAVGTAVTVAPMTEVVWRERAATLPADRPLASRLLAALTDAQTGRVPDRHGWLTVVRTALCG